MSSNGGQDLRYFLWVSNVPIRRTSSVESGLLPPATHLAYNHDQEVGNFFANLISAMCELAGTKKSFSRAVSAAVDMSVPKRQRADFLRRTPFVGISARAVEEIEDLSPAEAAHIVHELGIELDDPELARISQEDFEPFDVEAVDDLVGDDLHAFELPPALPAPNEWHRRMQIPLFEGSPITLGSALLLLHHEFICGAMTKSLAQSWLTIFKMSHNNGDNTLPAGIDTLLKVRFLISPSSVN